MSSSQALRFLPFPSAFCCLQFCKTARNLILFLAVAAVACSFGIAADRPKYDFEIRRQVDLAPNQFGYSDARLDLGELPNQSVGLIEIEATNSGSRPVVLGNTFSGCKCLEVTLSSSVVEPSKSVTIRVVLRVQNEKEASKLVGLHIAPKEQPDAGMRVALRYQVAGVLAFQSQSIAVAYPEDKKSHEVRIPITLTAPVEARNLIAVWQGPNESVKGRIARDNGGWVVALSFPRAVIANNSVAGTIEVTDTKLEISESALCIVELENLVTVVPSTLRFSWSEANNCWEANAIIKLRNEVVKEEANQQLASGDAPQVEAFVAEHDVEVTSKSMPKSLVRVIVRINEQDLTSETHPEIFWKIHHRGKLYRSKNPFLILR